MDVFPTKTAAKAFVSAFLQRYKGLPWCERISDAADLVWIEDLLSRHPRWAAKARGMDWVGVHAGHFCLVGEAGQHHEDISFHKCLTPPTPRQDVMRACRAAVQDQITAFRRAAPPGGIMCAMPGCGARLPDTGAAAHVDHIRPFVRLVDAWLGERDPASVATISTGTGHVFAPAAAADESAWATFHAAHAQLRLVCAHCNLTRPRKDSYL